MSYRNQARDNLKRAKEELASDDDHRLKYAALELRFAMEALTYDRAHAYKAELPPAEYETWQPRKLMAVLLETDPNADKDSFLLVGVEETPGVPAPVMEALGGEQVFNLALLKKHYDAIGNYLHVQTLKQAASGPIDLKKFRAQCEKVAGYVEQVLASEVWNAIFGSFASIQCENCGGTIRRRIPHGLTTVTASCFDCVATYTITDTGNGQVGWKIDAVDVTCANKECGQTILILKPELKAGNRWTCPACNGSNTLTLAITHAAASTTASTEPPEV